MSKSAMHFELALVEAIHEAMVAGDDLFIPGLGTFSIDHRPAKIESGEQSTTIVHPPVNRIKFMEESADDIIPEFKTR